MSRIALAVSRDRDRELLAGAFSDHEVVAAGESVPDGTDLCIIDEAGLDRLRTALDAWRESQHPTFAPVLLLARAETSNPWERYGDELNGRVDAVERIPTPKAAAASRIETLLEMRDISRALTTEYQLNERIFETSPLAKVVLTADGEIIRANERAEDVLGLSRSELTGRAYDTLAWVSVDEDDTPIPGDERAFARVVATGEPVYDHVEGIERPDGDRTWLSVNMAPIRDQRREIEYVVGILDDVTARRTQEQELERQVDLFEKAQSLATVGAWEYDVRTGDSYWTEEVYRIHGLPLDVDPSPALSLQYFHPDDRPVIDDAFARAIERGEPYDLELRLVDESGNRRWVRTQGDPQYENGDLIRVRGTIQDITDRKEREVELQRMTRSVDEAPIGITLSDPERDDNPIVYVNDRFVELTGYDREEVLGRNCRFLQGEHTDPETVAEIREAIAAEESVSVTLRNYRADGTEFWNHLEIAPIHDADGDVINFIGFQQDVTERIERQRQIQKLDQYLRHNIRNEMNVVGGLAERIEAEGAPPLAEAAALIQEHATSLMAEMEKERAVVQLLGDEPIVESVDLGSLLRSVLAECQEAYPDVELSLSAPETVSVRATSQLRVAFEELIRNAIDHADSQTPVVAVCVTVEGDDVIVRVADDGPGIPALERELITSRTEETQLAHGQGLGLWLVYLIVRRSDGRIDFEENEPRGSVVTVVLSAADGT